ncbi:MAG: hypothetical protein AABW41_00025 [Nanoarchaeota archaeon]
MKNKKAQLFLVTLTLLAFTILTLSIIAYQTSQSFENRLSDIASFERLSNLDLSAQKVLKNIFDDKSGINVTIKGLDVTFEETLPNVHAEFNASLDSFKNYLETNFDSINLSIGSIKQYIPLLMPSHNIFYNHSQNNVINITNSEFNINALDVYFATNSTLLSGYSCSLTMGSSPSILLSVSGDLANGGRYDCVGQIDPTKHSLASINTSQGNMTVIITNPGTILITVPNGVYSKVKTKMTVNNTNENQLEVRYPLGVININFVNLGVKKLGDARIA